jgi:RNA-binding protein Musashi
MRDGVTGRSRGFGFLTFKDPKVVNVVMVKEHLLDGKLVCNSPADLIPTTVIWRALQIDPKRAIPRDEQEKTSKIFVGGVSQEATETDFRQFFAQFGNVLDCTLMMDKDTGRPRGFGFVTFDDDVAVERALSQPLAIHGKPIEVKRAEPRGNLREEGGGGGGRGGRFGGAGRGGGAHQANFGAQQDQAAQAGGANNMSPAMMAQYWQRMQQYFQMMQQQMQGGGMAGMNPQMAAMQQNPAMMQQMMASMGRGQGGGNPGMNSQMMQQMQQMQGGGGMQGGAGPAAAQGGYPGGSMSGSASPGPAQQQSGFNAQEQMHFEQQKYERQQMARMQGQSVNGGSTWEGMYDDVPAPAGVTSRGGGGFAGRGGRGGARGGPATPGNAPVGAPTGPKNAGLPGSNYRGGGRGGRGGGGGGRFDPYARNAK